LRNQLKALLVHGEDVICDQAKVNASWYLRVRKMKSYQRSMPSKEKQCQNKFNQSMSLGEIAAINREINGECIWRE
jgi:hypothetical protein